MKRVLPLLLLASPLLAHMMSMSSGDLTVTGDRVHYELRMPLYELSHIKDPDQTLLENIHFFSGGQEGKLVDKSCQQDTAGGSYVCDADYEFPAPVEKIEVECTYYEVTVTNHVHLLRAERNGKHDQAIFDFSFTKATLNFAPPSPVELAVKQVGEGFIRALGGLVQILFLASLVLASRSRRELLVLTGMFLFGQVGSALIVPLTRWVPPARFVEAAAALTVAYLAVEILMLPEAGWRWLIIGVLGGFHGLFFALLLENTGYGPAYVLAGAGLAEILAIGIIALIFSRIQRIAEALRPVQVSASVLLVIGIVWFFVRLRG